jgi:hypothetical protein
VKPKIYRYPVTTRTINKFEMPKGAKVVDAVWQQERNEFSLYAVVYPEQEKTEAREFVVYATGETIIENSNHIRSIVMPDGFHVFHVFEVFR